MDSSQEPLTIKLVVVGDGSVGKTCILLSYTTDKFPTDYVPTVFDNYTSQVQVDNQMVNLSLCPQGIQLGKKPIIDQEHLAMDRLISFLSYFLLQNNPHLRILQIKFQWFPELSKDDLKAIPKIFVGNKIDMRNDNDSKHIHKDAAKQLISQQNCKYFECSALTQEGLKEIFDEAIRAVLQIKKNGPGGQQTKNEKKEVQTNQNTSEKPCCMIQ